MAITPIKPEWREILKARSTADKIGIERSCESLPVGALNHVADMVRAGVIVWIDRTVLRHLAVRDRTTGVVRIGIYADVYQLTVKGIRLCNENGIEQQ